MKRIVLFVADQPGRDAWCWASWPSLLGVNRYLTANGLNLRRAAGLRRRHGFRRRDHLAADVASRWPSGAPACRSSTAPADADEAWIVETVRALRRQGRHRHARGRHLRRRAQRLRHRRLQEQRAGGGVHRPAAGHDRDEVEAVIGHEVAHIANGDMVTMTLIQGVMNTFVVFLSRVIGYFVDSLLAAATTALGPGHRLLRHDHRAGHRARLRWPPIIVAWFSRQREFRADAGSAAAAGPQAADDQRAGPPGRHGARRAAQGPADLGHHRRAWASCSPPTRRSKSASRRCSKRRPKPVAGAQGRSPRAALSSRAVKSARPSLVPHGKPGTGGTSGLHRAA